MSGTVPAETDLDYLELTAAAQARRREAALAAAKAERAATMRAGFSAVCRRLRRILVLAPRPDQRRRAAAGAFVGAVTTPRR